MSVRAAYARGRQVARMGRQGAMRATQERKLIDDGRSRIAYRLLGVNLDQPPTEIQVTRIDAEQPKYETAWSAAESCRPRHGARERMGGWAPVHTENWVNTYAAGWLRYAAEQSAPFYLVWAPTAVYVSDGSNWYLVHTEALPFEIASIYSTNLENHTVFGHAGGVARAVDYRSGTPSAAPQLTDWPATWTTRVIGTAQGHLLAAGMQESGVWYEDRVRWSHPFDPGELPTLWQPAADNLAGDAQLSGIGPFRAMLGLRNGVVLYRDRETWIGTYVRAPYVWDFRRVFSKRGCSGPSAVAEVAGRHFVVSDGDFGVHDGVNWQTLSDGKARRWLQARHAPSWPEAGLGRLIYVAPTRELWYGIPGEDGYIDEVLIYSLESNEFTVRPLTYPSQSMDVGNIASAVQGSDWDTDNNTWDSDWSPWSQGGAIENQDKPIFSAGTLSPGSTQDVQLQLRAYEIGNTENGIAVQWRLERRGLDLGDPSAIDTIHEVWPRIENLESSWLSVRVGFQDNERDPVTWGAPQLMFPGDEYVGDIEVSGRFIAVELGGIQAEVVRVEGFDLVYTRKGRGG